MSNNELRLGLSAGYAGLLCTSLMLLLAGLQYDIPPLEVLGCIFSLTAIAGLGYSLYLELPELADDSSTGHCQAPDIKIPGETWR